MELNTIITDTGIQFQPGPAQPSVGVTNAKDVKMYFYSGMAHEHVLLPPRFIFPLLCSGFHHFLHNWCVLGIEKYLIHL